MFKCKITVLKRMFNQDLAEQFCGIQNVPLCHRFQEGQEFIAGLEKPDNFCDWAWNDIYKVVITLLSGGNFSKGIIEGWMKDDKSMIVCCTDAIRPVAFKIERIEE